MCTALPSFPFPAGFIRDSCRALSLRLENLESYQQIENSSTFFWSDIGWQPKKSSQLEITRADAGHR